LSRPCDAGHMPGPDERLNHALVNDIPGFDHCWRHRCGFARRRRLGAGRRKRVLSAGTRAVNAGAIGERRRRDPLSPPSHEEEVTQLAHETWRLSSTALLLLGFFLVALWELYWPRRRLDHPITNRWIGNLALYFINAAVLAWLFAAPAAAAERIYAGLNLGVLRWPRLPGLMGFALVFLLVDCLRYWLHRLFHVAPVLWRLHSLHHADSDLDVSTSFRHHPVEFGVGSMLFSGILFLSGCPPVIAADYLLAASILTCLQHGNVGLPPLCERLLQTIFITPDMHRIHHSLVADEANSNYGFMFSFWDRIFGSRRAIPPAAHKAMEFGIVECENPSFARMLLLPLTVSPLVGHAIYSKSALRKSSIR